MNDILPTFLTISVQVFEDEDDNQHVAMDTVGNGPFGSPFKEFKLWTEFYPS